jgi:ATP adenylyltransferase
MVAPVRHTADYPNLHNDELAELNMLVQKSVMILKRVYHPAGFNIGINLGRAAGAGVATHLHVHVVPRWLGDINFMPVTAETKVMPESLAETYDRLYPEFRKLKL